MSKGNQAEQEVAAPKLGDLLAVFEMEDARARLAAVRDRVLPVVREEMAECKGFLVDVYGDGWLELVTPSVHPSAGVTADTDMPTTDACVGYAAKARRDRAYRKFTGQGKRAMYLDVRGGLALAQDRCGAWLRIRGRPEVGLFGEIWHAFRDEVLALLESSNGDVWSDPPFPEPPEIPLDRQLDLVLRSDGDYLCLFGQQASADWSGPSASWAGQWGAVCLWPIFIGVIEAALDRQPSVRAFHDRLCKWLSAATKDDGGEEGDEPMSSRTRYLVFKRDQFRCVMCGATAAEGAKLQADHIIPKSRGGRAVLSNLQTLCDRCNRGKGADLSPDLRARR